MKALPLGVSDFNKIRSYPTPVIYVDKTEHIYRMVNSVQTYYFLSRPRRFGKTLLVSTLKALFEGRKELFEGLYIADKWDFAPHPVIHINLAGGESQSDESLWENIDQNLRENEQKLGVSTSQNFTLATRFYDLIRSVYHKYKKHVVVLIDEYDKPLIDTLMNQEQLERNRQTLRGFYSKLKQAEPYLRFVFLTGVSKFSQVSIFSGLNNLRDISFLSHYSTICGYTQEELERDFAEHLVDVDMEQMKLWYDGYNFMAKDKRDHVYAPYDVLLYLDEKENFQSYWFDTGTSDFLVNVLKARNERITLSELESAEVEKILLSVNNIESMPLAELLFQTGYLTLKKEQVQYDDTGLLHVGIPNHSVRIALSKQLVRAIMGDKYKTMLSEGSSALNKGDLKKVEKDWNTLLAAIPYDNAKMKSYEAYYQSIVFMYCYMMGLHVHAEEHTSEGRIDMSILLDNRVYVCEFKLENRGQDPIQQIRDKGYAEKFTAQYKQITLVGILCNPKPNRDKGEKIMTLTWEEY